MGLDEVAIRLGAPTDLPAIARLRREWTEENAGEPVGDEDFEDELVDWWAAEASRRVVLLAEAGDAAVGMLDLALFRRMPRPGVEPSSWCYLSNLYVDAAHRDVGVGTSLLSTALAVAHDWGCVRIVLSPTERSVSLYARAGFAPATMLMARALR